MALRVGAICGGGLGGARVGGRAGGCTCAVACALSSVRSPMRDGGIWRTYTKHDIHALPLRIGSVRTEVVHFVGFGGLATSLAPGRGTYGLARSAAFQGCKDRRKILKWRHMRAFSGSVSDWCGRAEAARKPPRLPPSVRAASVSVGRKPRGSRAASAAAPLSGAAPRLCGRFLSLKSIDCVEHAPL
jgi:hypothetical protein